MPEPQRTLTFPSEPTLEHPGSRELTERDIERIQHKIDVDHRTLSGGRKIATIDVEFLDAMLLEIL